MHCLIVHAHPEPRSFTAAMKDEAIAWAEAQGHRVTLSDLHAMNFNPVATAEDFAGRKDPDYLVYAMEQRHGYDNGTIAPDILAEVEKVQAADLLILSFPMYWFSLPAMLKGWIDRVFLSGPFYGGRRFYDRGGMAGKKALLAFTLGGREHMFGPGSLHGPMNDILRPVLQGALAYTGFEVLPPFIGYHVPYLDDAARGQILADYRDYLQGLDGLTPLVFPSLDDFDDKMRPKAG